MISSHTPRLPMPTLPEKFRGCLLGAAIGDVAGAPVEAESPAHIAANYRSIDDILATPSVPEFQGPDWQVGRFTDDTEMALCVAEWLCTDPARAPVNLLARLADAHDPSRRYGPSTESILRLFPKHQSDGQHLATASFPHGSYGNGSATRAHPIGLARFDDLKEAARVAIASSRPTHSHPLACQGAVLQTIAVATAVTEETFDPAAFLQ